MIAFANLASLGRHCSIPEDHKVEEVEGPPISPTPRRIPANTAIAPNCDILCRMMRPLALLNLLALASCNGDKPGEWSLFVYPQAADHQNWQRTDRFQSKGMCRQAGEEAVAALPDPAKAAFECRHTGPPA